MKDCVNGVNIRSSKDKTSKYQSSSKTSSLTTEEINIQLNDVTKESRKWFYESKEQNEKIFPLKPNTRPLKMKEKQV